MLPRSLLALLVLSLVLPSLAADEAKSPLGRKIAGFTLQDPRGKEYRLDDFKEQKLVVVAFLGTECPLAKTYGARLAKLAAQYESKGVAFVGLDANAQD